MQPTTLAVLATLAFSAVTQAASVLALSSPDNRIQLQVSVEDGRLHYSVTANKQPVIDRSQMAMTIDGVNVCEGVKAGRADRYRVDETYPWYGNQSVAVNRANGARIAITHSSGTSYTVEARAYNNGAAFRFLVPGGEAKKRIPDEATTFQIPAGSTVWYHDFEGHYEATHVKKSIQEIPAGDWAAPPVTFKLPGNRGYGSITEGALLNYSGMGLQADGRRGFQIRLGHAHPPSYPFRLRYKEDIEPMSRAAAIAGDIRTPWRIIMAAPDLNRLVNNGIVHNVSAPPDRKLFPKGINTEWIKPGRAVWKYLDGGENTLAEMRNFSKLAAELGFEYNVIEGFWQKWSEQELKDFVEYSRELGVGIILWKHSRDMRDPANRQAFFELCKRTGVRGAKLDFYDHEHKDVVELYEACLKDAARFQQVINFHGANKPTGEARTWPNELTREAIRGMESRRTVRAQHDATLPFTRMLAGHADYTPMVFGERRNDTTWAHQIATAAIFTSPLLVYGAHPQSILSNPAVEVIRAIPSVWDETVALPVSEIGEVAAFARRRGGQWFLAIVNGSNARALDISLAFLGSGKYQATMIRDSPKSADSVEIQKTAAVQSDSIQVELRSGGGFIARFSR